MVVAVRALILWHHVPNLILPRNCPLLLLMDSPFVFRTPCTPPEFAKLVSLGFTCETDVANLRGVERAEFSNGFFLEDEAQCLFELA